MEAFLIKLGLQVVLKFYQKNPWAIMPTLLCLAMPVILVASMLGAAANGISKGVSTKTVSCSDSYENGVNKVFQNVSATDKNANLAKSSMTSSCADAGGASTAGYMYDTTIWQSVVDKAKGFEHDGSAYDDGKIQQLLTLALSGTGQNLPDAQKKAFQDQVKADFADMEKANKGKASIYKAIASYAQDKVDDSLAGYDSSFANAIIAAAQTRIGDDYVLGGTWTPSKQEYCSGGLCGFDCARLVGWALAQANGVDTSSAAEPAAPYGRVNVDMQYAALIKMGATPIPEAEKQPGDFVYIRNDTDGTFGHVALYAGAIPSASDYSSTKTDMYIESPQPGEKVRERDSWWGSYSVQFLRVANLGGGNSVKLSGDNSVADNSPAQQAAKAYAKSRLASYGWAQDSTGSVAQANQQYLCLLNLWHIESNWNLYADNPSSNAYGIPQALPGSKMASIASDWRTNYHTQIIWGMNYVRDRYGSPCAAYQFETSHTPYWY